MLTHYNNENLKYLMPYWFSGWIIPTAEDYKSLSWNHGSRGRRWWKNTPDAIKTKSFSSYYKSNTIVPGLGDGHLTYDAKGEKKHATTFFFF